MEIECLISEPESKVLEFKGNLSSLHPMLKTLVAFANTAGGTLIVGVSDEGEVVGVKQVLKEVERLASGIADSIEPQLLPEIEIATVQGKDLLIVQVAHWKGPFYLKKEGPSAGVYVRLGSITRVAGPELVAELSRSAAAVSFDQTPLPNLSTDVLDQAIIREHFAGREINPAKLSSLGVITQYKNRFVPSVGGLILFGTRDARLRSVPDARVRCARFLGKSKAEILDQYEVEGTILEAIQTVPQFIARNTRLSAKFGEMVRQDIPEYPPSAVREVLINAALHADYSMSGSHIQVAIFDDRLEIQSPGMLPAGFTFDDFRSGISKIRNRVIARVLHELKLIEAWGSGYRRCRQACEEGGFPLPVWEEIGTFVRVTFYPHPHTQRTMRLSEGPEGEITRRQLAILALFREEESLAVRDILARLPEKVSERTIRYELALLKAHRVLVPRGRGRATVWELA